MWVRIVGPMLFALSAPAYALNAPVRYSHAYEGQLVIKELTTKESLSQCSRFASFACSSGHSPISKTCTIWLPKIGEVVNYKFQLAIVDARFQSGVLLHEVAHCNGWPADHRS